MTMPRNPYDFVPLEGTPSYVIRRPSTAASGYSGVIRFQLHTLTPLFIHQAPSARGVYQFASLQQQPMIPATSLKGMLRSVHEAVTNSTLGMLAGEHRDAFYRERMPKEYRPGERTDRLTASEALFGIVGGKGNSSVGYAGRVLFSDINIARETLRKLTIRRPSSGGAPQPTHRSFYFDDRPPQHILGRKFYYHQDEQKLTHFYDTNP
jgi:hypothetical protein